MLDIDALGDAIAEMVKDRVAVEVAKAVGALPVPQAGRDGRDGLAGQDGQNGADGKDGINGADGLGFDDIVVEHDGERCFKIKFVQGDRTKEFPFAVPMVLDRGYFKEGDGFTKGDGVTFGGSYWIAQTVTRSKPEIGNPEWRLAVKKGRDGKAAVDLK